MSPSMRRMKSRTSFRTLQPAHGDAYLRIQRVRGGPGGCHLDLHVDDAGQGAHRAGELGATVLTANNTVVNTIDYKNTAIILRVQPRVSICTPDS